MDTISILIIVGLVTLALFVITALLVRRRSGHLDSTALKDQFGPEYDRAIEQHANPRKAEQALRDRVKAVRKLDVRPLSGDEFARFTRDWRRVQERFLDAPRQAVDEGHALVEVVMSTRGYPVNEFEEQVELLSVDHGSVIHHYRAARHLAEARTGNRAETEDLRQAMVHYRALFMDLLVAEDRGSSDERVSTQPQPQW